jgi:hypothetical protein
MSTPEDLRRSAEDGPEDDMRQEVHIDQLQIPSSTKLALGGLLTIVAALVTWNLVETIAIQKAQANDKRELWIEIGKLQAADAVTEVRLRSLESRAERQGR